MAIDKEKIAAEEERIRTVYAERRHSPRQALYDRNRPDVRHNDYFLTRRTSELLARLSIDDFAGKEIVDVGCGDGTWLRKLVEGGAEPARLHGVDLLGEKLAEARAKTPGVDFRLANGVALPFNDQSVDIIFAHTLFSSVLDSDMRSALSAEMMRVRAPGGTIVVYDFVVARPGNRATLGIGSAEIRRLFPGMKMMSRSLTLAPPLARVLCPAAPALALLAEEWLPFLRTHRLYALYSDQAGGLLRG